MEDKSTPPTTKLKINRELAAGLFEREFGVRCDWFEAKLATLSRKDCNIIAGRAALRALPVLRLGLEKNSGLRPQLLDDVLLSMFRCQILGLAAVFVDATNASELRSIFNLFTATEAFRAAAEISGAREVYGQPAFQSAGNTSIDAIAAAAYSAAYAVDAASFKNPLAARRSAAEAAVSCMDALYAVGAPPYVANGTPLDPLSTAVKTIAALIADIEFLGDARSSKLRRHLAVKQLWSGEAPSEIKHLWVGLKMQLNRAGRDWDVWSDWYFDVLNGDHNGQYIFGLPTEYALKLWQDVALTRDAIWKSGPAKLNAEFKRLVEEARAEAVRVDPPSVEEESAENHASLSDSPPELPDQLPGQQWGYDEKTQKIGLIASGQLTDEQEKRDVQSLLPTVRECIADLQRAVDKCQSNSIKALIVPIIDSYSEAVNAETISIDRLYGAGVRLRNAYERSRKDASEEGLKDFDANIGEPFDSVLGLHGPLILGTSRGKLLYDRALNDQMTKQQELQYKEKARAFAQRIHTQTFIDARSKQAVMDGANEVGTGPHPYRSTDLSFVSNQNLLVYLSLLASKAVSEIATQGVMTSAVGSKAITIAASVTDGAFWFLINNAKFLFSLAATCGTSLAWLPHLIAWLRAMRK